MDNDTTIFPGLTFSTTGITGNPGQEISRDAMLYWVENYADRESAIKFDSAISVAVDRDEAGNLFGVMEQCRYIEALAS